jgi:hypothetical protein
MNGNRLEDSGSKFRWGRLNGCEMGLRLRPVVWNYQVSKVILPKMRHKGRHTTLVNDRSVLDILGTNCKAEEKIH